MSDQLVSSDPNWNGAVSAPPSAVAPGSERTRQDTSAIGVNHEDLANRIANWASTLPPAWQKPAAMLATFPADVMASLAEMFSAPESIATAGARPATAALDAAGTAVKNAPGAAVRGVAAVGDVVHPDVIGMVSPRAGKVVTVAQRVRGAMDGAAPQPEVPPPPDFARIVRKADRPNGPIKGNAGAKIAAAKAEAAATAASAEPSVAPAPPAAAPPDASAPPTPSATPATAPPSPPASAGSPRPVLTGWTYDELKEYQRMVRAGTPARQAMDSILQQRELMARFGLKTPTVEETKFPKGMRGKRPPAEDR